MRTFGIKVSANRITGWCFKDPDGWEGYWQYKTGGVTFRKHTAIRRSNCYDAEQDAIRSAKQYSKDNNIQFITEGYVV